MDWPRTVILAMIAVVCVCYFVELVRVLAGVKVWHPALRGRVALCVGIVLAAAAGVHGLIVAWGEPLTFSTVLLGAATVCFAYGYLHMARFEVR